MLIDILLTLAGVGLLALLVMFAYGAWIAHKLTMQELMPVSGG